MDFEADVFTGGMSFR